MDNRGSTIFAIILLQGLTVYWQFIQLLLIREGSVPRMCTSGGRQCESIRIAGLEILVHPNQTWMFSFYDITIKMAKCTKYEIDSISSDLGFVHSILSFLLIICVDERDKGYKVAMYSKSLQNTQKYLIKAYNFFRFGV